MSYGIKEDRNVEEEPQADGMSACGPPRHLVRRSGSVAFGGIVLQNTKMRVGENFAIFPSKWIFGNTMPCSELTKEAGWKSDC